MENGTTDSGFSTSDNRGYGDDKHYVDTVCYSSMTSSTKNDTSSTAELLEINTMVCDVVRCGNWMKHGRLHQESPTTVFQDNMPAITIVHTSKAGSKIKTPRDLGM